MEKILTANFINNYQNKNYHGIKIETDSNIYYILHNNNSVEVEYDIDFLRNGEEEYEDVELESMSGKNFISFETVTRHIASTNKTYMRYNCVTENELSILINMNTNDGIYDIFFEFYYNHEVFKAYSDYLNKEVPVCILLKEDKETNIVELLDELSFY